MADQIIGSVGIQIEADASDLQGQYDAAVAQSQEAAGRIASAFESLVGIGAALEITEGIKNFGEAALEAFGDIEKTTISIEHMTGSMEQTADILSQVKEIGLASPFSFPELQDTTQKMIAMGVPVEKIGDSLRGITDAAAATGKSLLVAGGAFDRITETGSAASRQLAQLGVTTERLGDVLGVTRDKVLQAFKDLPDQAARIDVLNQAMERFAGSAEAQAAGIQGAWQILENRFELVMQGIGSALEPAIKALIGLATTATGVAQELVDDFNTLSDPVKEFIGILGIAVAAVAPLAAAIGIFGQGLIGIQAVVGSVTTLLGALGLTATETAVAEGEATIATTALAAAQRDLALAEAEAAEAPMLGPLSKLGTALEEAGLASRTGAEGITLFETGTAEATTAVEGFSLGLTGSAAAMVGPVAAGLLAMKIGYDDLKASYKAMADEMTTNSIQHLLATGSTVADLEKIGFTVDQIRSTISNFGIQAATVFGSLQQSTDPPIKALMGLGASIDEIKDKLKGMQVEGVPVFQILANSPDFATFKKNLELLGGNIDDVVRKLDGIAALSPSVVAGFQSMSQGITVHITNTKGLEAAEDALVKKQGELDEATVKAKAVLDGLTQKYNDHKVSLSVVEAALAAYDKALKASSAGNKDYQDTVGGLLEAYSKNQSAINTLTGTISQLLAVQDRSIAQEAVLDQAIAKRWDLIQKNISALKDQMTAEDEALISAQKLVKSSTDLDTAQRATALAVGLAKTALDELSASDDKSVGHQQAVIQAMQQYQIALKNAGQEVNGYATILVNGVLTTVNMGKAIADAKAHAEDFRTTMVTVPQVVETATGRLNGMVIPLGFVNTGLSETVTIINNGAIPALKTYTDLHPQLASAANVATSSLAKINQETQVSVTNAGRAAGSNSTLLRSFTDLGDGVVSSSNGMAAAFSDTSSGLISVHDAAGLAANGLLTLDEQAAASAQEAEAAAASWNDLADAIKSALDAEGVSGASKGSAGTFGLTAPGAAPKAGDIKGMTGGGLTNAPLIIQTWTQAEIDNLHAAENLTKQLQQYAQQMVDAGIASNQTSGILSQLEKESGNTGKSLSSLVSAYISSVKSTDTHSSSVNSNTVATDANVTAVNNKTTATTSAANATNGLSSSTSGLTDSLGALNSATSNTANAQEQFVDGLGNVYSSYMQMVDAIKANPLLGGPANSLGPDLSGGVASSISGAVVGPDGKTYNSAQDLYNAIQANPNLLPHIGEGPTTSLEPGGTGQSGTLYTFNGQVVSEAMYRALTQNGGGGPAGSSADFKAPSAINTGAGVPVTWNTGPQASNTQGPQGITLVMNYPVFQSQQQSSQIFSQAVTMLRTVPGIKL